MKRFILIVISLLLISTGYSQTGFEFNKDPLEFTKSVEKYFKKAKYKNGLKTADKFAELWELKGFSNKQEEAIINMSNSLIQSRMRGPEFETFYQSLIYFSENQHDANDFDDYFSVLHTMGIKSTREVMDVITLANNLFNDISLFVSPSNSWGLAERTFEFDMEGETPVLICENADVIASARNDRSGVYKTSGVYYPIIGLWKGTGGVVNWARGGLDTTQVFAEVKTYEIETKRVEFSADSVVFFYKSLLEEAYLGSFTDKLTSQYQPENATYPKFDSYIKKILKKDIFKNVDYEGGLSMAGGKLIGFGDSENPAKLNFYSGDTLTLRTFSDAYIFYPDKINALSTEVSIYMGEKDSIYHPEIELKFLADKREVTIIRQGDGIKKTAFYDTYHEINILLEAIYWNIDSREMEFGMINTQTKSDAYFESTNYYRKKLFTRVQGLMTYNPLVSLYLMQKDNNTRNLGAAEFAHSLNMEIKQVKGMLRQLVADGFIYYDEEEEEIYIKDKTVNFVQNNAGNLDYDIIKIKSYVSKGNNAILDIKDYVLDINGVSQIFMSDSQSVYIVPSEQQVKMFGNRNMQFGGQIHAGTLDFYGKGFNFDYENFKINLQNIDSMTIMVLGGETALGKTEFIDVETVLQNINGDLYIDDKDNKSGLKDLPQYPLFDSKKESFVFYDAPKILNSVYDRERFFFRVIPFQIDSLDNLTSTTGLAFPGILYSDNIFPELKEVLVLQKDTSLGFVHETPVKGLPMYKDKGNFLGQIFLSEAGLLGVGKLDYLTSTTLSREYTFMLDSTNINAKSYDMSKSAYQGTKYPQVHAEDLYIHWRPYSDSMFLQQKEKLVILYEEQAYLQGKMWYSPRNLSGAGEVSFNNARIRSNYFLFNQNDFKADTSDVELATFDGNAVAFNSNNVATKANFLKREVSFETNLFGPFVNLPSNQYETTLGKILWKIDDFTLNFSKGKGQTDEELYFESTHPKQDKLQFPAKTAELSLKNSVLDIFEVSSILVADAEIFPKDKFVQVNKDAVMTTLPEARIEVNTKTRFHELFNGEIEIQGRRSYTGNADYEYVNKAGKVEKIHFDEISIEDSTERTIAKGAISDTTNFVLNPRIFFRGDVILQGDEKYLVYKGFAKIDQNSTVIKSEFFKYYGRVNPDSLLTEIIDPRSMDNKRLFTGIHQGNLSRQLYSTFVSTKEEPNDHNIIALEGELKYDEAERIFKIGDKNKMYGSGLKGDYLTFDDARDELYAEGKLDMGLEFQNAELPKINTVGNVLHELARNQIFFDVLLSIDFELPSRAWKLLGDKITSNTFDADLTINDRPTFLKGVSELLGPKDAAQVVEDVQLIGSFDMINELEHNLWFTELNMLWDETTRSYVSVGPVGLGAIGKDKIGKRLTGKVVLNPNQGDDEFQVYIQAADNIWWYFRYRRGIAEAVSSDQEFNDAIASKTKSDKPFTVSTPRAKADFLKKFPILD
ncbi:MAG: hypothetical protein ACJAZ3_000904 [Sphingobacteriales bacterium]|jgi:hypothetical protein